MAYADLLADVADTIDRDDLATRLPRWLKLVEARLNRLLEDPDMEVSTTLTGDGADLPADFGEMISIGTADGNRLSPVSNVEYSAFRPSTGTSRLYTIREGKIYYAPGSANPTLVYRRTLPPLVEGGTNWLLERAPDVYFYGVLLQANAWSVDTEAAAGWKNLWDEAISELRTDGARRKWGAGPIAPRIRRA
ncbi:MAG TPA: hypothetical protein VF637_09045 [Sphingomicrobium sp.]|jgi:hypothetical protein